MKRHFAPNSFPLCNFTVKCLGADADLARQGFPFPFRRHPSAPPFEPCIQSRRDGFQGYNFGLLTCALNFVREMADQRIRKVNVLANTFENVCFCDAPDRGRLNTNCATMIGARVERRFRDHSDRARTLKRQTCTLRAAAFKIDCAPQDYKQRAHWVVLGKKAGLSCKLLLVTRHLKESQNKVE